MSDTGQTTMCHSLNLYVDHVCDQHLERGLALATSSWSCLGLQTPGAGGRKNYVRSLLYVPHNDRHVVCQILDAWYGKQHLSAVSITNEGPFCE